MLEVPELAERQEVCHVVVRRIVLKIGAGKADARPGQLGRPSGQGRELEEPTPFAIAPGAALGVPPAAVPQMRHVIAMRAPATLALALGPTKADGGGELAPKG